VRPALRRAATLVAVGLAVAVVCTFLGRWQWHRHVTRDALIATVEANWAAPTAPLASLVPAADAEPVAGDEWRSVTMTGEYLPESTVLLRNRPVNGTPAYHVLVPFRTESSALLVVDRGWVPLGADGQTTADVPAPPSGTVTLVGRLRLPEAPSDRSAPAGQVQSVDVDQVLAAGGAAVAPPAYRWYVGLSAETPAPATALGALPEPSTDPGPHLSYAVQWWVFAAGGLVAFCWLARRELLDDAKARAAQRRRAAVTAGWASSAPPQRRRGRDELAEDALIDAQLRASDR
jgi:cytochrome oxidase assembly protein ShyY1